LFTGTYFSKGTNSLGDRIVGATVETTPGFVNLNESSRKLGSKQYELSNHLGNVLVTVSDKKIPEGTVNNPITGYVADVTSSSDYYRFGMQMGNRNFSSPSYRYGFNGMEKDDEWQGQGNSYDFGARMYDPRLGRWLAVDPLMKKYPSLSPYSFVANTPLIAIDPDGEKIFIVGGRQYRRTVKKLLKSLAKQSSYGRLLVTQAIESESVIAISSNPDEGIGLRSSMTDENGDTKTRFTFNLDEAGNPLDAANGRGDAALESPSEVTLAHELQHFVDKINNVQHSKVINPKSPTFEDDEGNLQWNTISTSEVSAVEGENKVRSQMGLKLRTHYGGFNVLNKEASTSKFKGFNVLKDKSKPVDFDAVGKSNVPLSGGTKHQSLLQTYWKHSFKEKEGPTRSYGFGHSKVNSNGQKDPGSTEIESAEEK
jgi:RHS repeat-associated protein